MSAEVVGKIVFVTGGASGIGRAAAEAFSVGGAEHVVVADLDREGAEETVGRLVGSGSAVALDVTDEQAVAAVVDEIVDRFGRLDAAFNNAGINDVPRQFHELDAAHWDRMIAVNLSSVFYCMKHELRHMAAAGNGSIVNTSSGAGVVAAPGLPHYTAAKHGVVGLTKAAAQEYVRQGIRVNAVLPGSTDTAMMRSFIAGDEGMAKIIAASNIHGSLIAPQDIASAVVWLSSDQASMVNGQSLVVDGGGIVR
jgi:NAD(P)-dependent dehydrogenase (short-subunit alcohol dehydrogenase family)